MTPLGFETKVSGFVDQRLIHWAMKSTPPMDGRTRTKGNDQEPSRLLKSHSHKGWATEKRLHWGELKETIKSQTSALSMGHEVNPSNGLGDRKNDSTGNRTQSLWFRRPAPYPLGHEVNPSNGREVQELKGTIKSQVGWNHTTIRVGTEKRLHGDQTQSLWFRLGHEEVNPSSGREGQELKGTIKSKPAPYPLGHEVNPSSGREGQELKGTIKSQTSALSIGPRSQPLQWSGRTRTKGNDQEPKPYPLGHEVNPSSGWEGQELKETIKSQVGYLLLNHNFMKGGSHIKSNCSGFMDPRRQHHIRSNRSGFMDQRLIH
ncbi:hypothetical protein SDJN03_15844, partial [Cucurbita argyrosperma subsp. sororia]